MDADDRETHHDCERSKQMNHEISQTDILCYFTNFPTPRMQKIIRAVSGQGKVSLIYWKRSDIDFQSGLSDCAREIPVAASFLHNRGLCRIIAFLIFVCKSWLLIRRAKKARILYVNYLDVLLVAALAVRRRGVKFIYGIGDLAPAQYGGRPWVNATVRRLEQCLLKRVSVLILSSPFFWSEYYAKIYTGRWQLIENMPRAHVWKNFQPKTTRVPCVVGFVGWIRDYKPIECLLGAIGGLRRDGYDIRVFFAGFGPDEARLKQHCLHLDYVDFSGPYQYDRDAQALYSRVDIIFSVFDIGVANSKILMPNRFYDAIAAGLPLMVASGTKLAERVAALGIGYCVDYLSEDDMKAALISHIRCDGEAANIAEALRKVDKQAYFYDPYEKVLSDLFAVDKQGNINA
ncbi:MAG: glycosyltransferase [Smithellaceae bacterium]